MRMQKHPLLPFYLTADERRDSRFAPLQNADCKVQNAKLLSTQPFLTADERRDSRFAPLQNADCKVQNAKLLSTQPFLTADERK